MEYYVENKFKSEDNELTAKKIMEIAEEIIKKKLNESEAL